MSPLISIVITNYNRERYLGEAIASVLQQTWQDFELLVWDDGSTDGSVAIAQRYAQQDRRVRVVVAPHQGTARARKEAIAQTTGAYLGWVDSDDILAPTALSSTVAVLKHEPKVGLVYTDYVDINAEGQILGYGHRCRIPYSPQRLLVDFMTFHFRLLRRSVYKQVGGVHISASDYVEDYDICLRLSEVTQVRRVAKPLYFYRIHNQSVSVAHRQMQILWAQKAVAKALQRRGLEDKLSIDVELPSGRFILRRKPRQTTLTKTACASVACLLSLWGMNSAIAQAQTIIPAADATNTIVTPNGNRIDITGGTTSSNGLNLFHSFQQFGVSAEQIANFQANPNLQNILGRVTGGNASIINGLIQVTGGNANLFLMNPAGFIFGANASLNVQGAFTATTANGIKFDNGWFNAVSNNNYAALVGNPTGFAFTMSQPGAIINAGNLGVSEGKSLSLLGGTVVNTGQLTAPAGQIVLTSVPGQNWVRLSQPGNILSLELQAVTPNSNQPNNWTVAIASLPELITVGNTGLTANADGSVKLTNSNVTIPTTPGTTIVSGNVNVSGNTGGTVNILGTKVGLVGANINASSNNNGGNVLIGGDYKGGGTVPNATQTYVDSQTTINANSNQNGNGGRVIVWADNSAQFFGNISARGGANAGNGGFVEVSGKNFLTFNGQVDTTAINGQVGTLLLDPSTLNIIDAASGSGTFDTTTGTILSSDADNGANTISWGRLAALSSDTSINLQATGDITIEDITGASGVTSDNFASLDLSSGGSFRLTSANGAIRFVDLQDTIQTNGGAINISGASLSLGNLDTSNGEFTSPGGRVTLQARTGDITVGNIDTTGQGSSDFINGIGGDVTLEAAGNVTAGNIITSGFGYNSNSSTSTAGNVTITATGNIDVKDITATAQDTNATGGDVTLTTTNLFGSRISFNSIDTRAITTDFNGNAQGGNVKVLTNGLVQGNELIPETPYTIRTDAQYSNADDTYTSLTLTDGTVEIQHDGGADNVDFIVGNNTVNGTRGGINAGSASILSSGSFPVLPTGGTASGTPSNITIRSINTPPNLTTTSPISLNAQPGMAFDFTFTANVNDVNRDNTTVVIDAILTGTLRRGNTVLGAGDTLTLGETLNYTPPANITSSVNIEAFSVRASDRVSSSPRVPVVVGVEIPPPPPPPPPETPPSETPPPQVDNCKILPSACKPSTNIPPVDPPNNGNGDRTVILNPNPERDFTNAVARQLGVAVPETKTLDEASEILRQIEKATGVKPALIYLSFVPVEIAANTPVGNNKSTKILNTVGQSDRDQLEIIVVTGKGNPIRKRIDGTTRATVLQVAQEFRDQIVNPQNRETQGYLEPSQQLYKWIIAPLETDLQERGINNLVFLPDIGLRTTPMAALHDGKQFIVEKYSIGLMPSLSLTNTLYTDIKKSQVLALGISQSTQGQQPLPAVPVELSTLVSQLWPGKLLLDQQATLGNLKMIRRQQPFGIIHLATHADFIPGPLSNSYIQLWEDKLRLDQIRQLRLNEPQVEMMVLSACRTALGDEQAEIGFAGLAVLAGVKTSIASMWAVNDAGTAALMTKFYESLKTAPIRAEALREAQVAMAKGQVYIKDGRVEGLAAARTLVLPAESVEADEDTIQLTHPYYWAAFTMVGNPW
ncbi:filamentous haemagglutinin outer membrane protein [Nostoc sp. NIES-3756]|uniref:CHAT domain-containing protein n=1 Tax=Nostoc sp. NIES-3756 TaxID=1751286 RepID=UPI00072248DB|nr:CHAT domain-containing protein [Nostoc sp. NIES-3756]BAT52096.1 filamentous haemagglutinin outer membrane protein [Nostoc sp. NIES-3756]